MGRRPHGEAACQDGGEATRWRCVEARSGAPPEPGDNDEGIGAEPPPWWVHPRPQAARLDRREKGGARSSGAPDLAAATAAATTNPGGEVGPLVVLDDDRHGGSEGSAGHPTRALRPAEIDLPRGGAAAAAAEA